MSALFGSLKSKVRNALVWMSLALSACSGSTNANPTPKAKPPIKPPVACTGNDCVLISELCGNGIVDGDEACDDGNQTPADGCGADCKAIDSNYACLTPGQACSFTVVCGDSVIGGDETCDDGAKISGDGCDAACHVEAGWKCPTVGVACEADACGDGLSVGTEGCDDGNATGGDGCSATCQLETGWKCDTAGAACMPTVCGDGRAEGTEACDDGNNNMGDGCTPFCQREPNCSTGECRSVCGDGLRLVSDNEACEDSNNRAGDGCDATCQVEPGFTCTPSTASVDTLTLPIVLRDFKARNRPCWSGPSPTAQQCGHPDFEHYIVEELGIVTSVLGANGKPVYAKTGMSSPTTHSAEYFNQWYNDTPGVNQTVLQTISLNRLSSGVYQYNNSSFFPLDGLGFGNEGRSHNYHFTSEVRYWFEYKGNEQLDFTGDDDVWTFINKKRVIDLGGVHGAMSASVRLDATKASELGLTLGKVYEAVVFQAERHTTESRYRLTLSNFTNSVTTCQSVCGDGIRTRYEACDDGIIDGSYGHCRADCTRAPHCGDGIVQSEASEQCDDGRNITPYGTQGCAPGCKNPGRCGDGKTDAVFGEQCDDGNLEDNDLCTARCRISANYVSTR